MPGEYALDAFAVPQSLELLHQLFERVAVDHPRIPPIDLSLVETAVIEIAGNVIEHGQPPGEVEWQLRLDVHPDHLGAVLTDTSTKQAPDPGTATTAEPLSESGRGLALARAAVHELTYQRRDDHNTWTMTRRYTG
ncbi:ATP-binding protein [Flindersiella endophytica]